MQVPTARHGPTGLRLWFAVLAGIGAWMVHVTALSSLTQLVCNDGGLEWVMHLLTVITAGATVLSLWWALALARAKDDEAAGTPAGNTRFLGLFGLLTGGISLLLIVWEGLYVFFLEPCA